MRKDKFRNYRAKHALKPYVEWNGERSTRTIYHHDRAEVTYCRFFRRMAFRRYHFPDKGPEHRTRLLHSIEVATVASGMARRFHVDVDLTEAISLGHDIAQPPLGYPAEQSLRRFAGTDDFSHAKLGALLLQWHSLKDNNGKRFEALESCECYSVFTLPTGDQKIATISDEALDGIRKHTPPDRDGRPDLLQDPPLTIEGQLVRIADTLSYISQEIDEAIRMHPAFAEKLRSYIGNDFYEIQTDTGRCQMSRNDLLARPLPGIRHCGDDFLYQVFGPAVGPRLMSMVHRFEEYARARLSMPDLTRVQSHFSPLRVPILEFDPVLRFIIDFLWQDFIIGTVNRDSQITAVVDRTRQTITDVTETLLGRADTYNDPEFLQRKREVADLLDLAEGSEEFHRRVVAHYVSCLTDKEITDLHKKLMRGR